MPDTLLLRRTQQVLKKETSKHSWFFMICNNTFIYTDETDFNVLKTVLCHNSWFSVIKYKCVSTLRETLTLKEPAAHHFRLVFFFYHFKVKVWYFFSSLFKLFSQVIWGLLKIKYSKLSLHVSYYTTALGLYSHSCHITTCFITKC